MNREVKVSAYREFFFKSEAGKEFIADVERMVTANHERAEVYPESARDCTQRAKGNREVLDYITVVTTGVKKHKS